MDAQTLLKQVFTLRNESKTTSLTKLKPCSHVLSCLAMFHSKVFANWTFA